MAMVPTRHSIATRLMALTFAVYFVVAIVVTGAHMRFEYVQTRDNIIADLKVFQTTFQPILSQTVWSINRDALRKTVEGIAQAPAIAGVRILPNGLDEIAVGDIVDQQGKERVGVFGHSFPIIYKHPDGREEVLGKGVFYSSNAIVFERVKFGFAIILINALIKTAALWLIFSWLSNRLLRRPLATLTDAVQDIRFDELERHRIDLGARGRDELDQLATAFNGLLDKLQLARAELVEANRTLEHKVQSRTSKLELALKSQQAASEQLEHTLDNLRTTQKQLVHAEKMSSLGQLVAGVAHELNTPIGNARVTASILENEARQLRQAVETGELRRSALISYLDSAVAMSELVLRSCTRASDLIASFKQVAVDQTSERRRVFNLAELFDDIVAAMRPSFRNKPWRVEQAIPGDIECDSYPGPLGQVISNLVQNAVFHAFEGRAEGTLNLSARISGDKVVMLFVDDGKGMDETVLKHIFEPFFTTRMGQGGSGLGLSIAHNIVTNVLGGTMQADSLPDRGTRICVIIPVQAPTQENIH